MVFVSSFRGSASAIALTIAFTIAISAPPASAQSDIYQYSGAFANHWLGYSVAGAGDIDLDGFEDFILGAPGGGPADGGAAVPSSGAAYVVSGRTGLFLMSWSGIGAIDGFGAAVASAGDTNQDGIPDLVIAAPLDPPNVGNGYFTVRSGADGSERFSFGPSGASPRSVATAGDLNGDGCADVMVGWKLVNSGHVTLYSGQDGAILFDLSIGTPFDDFGVSVASVGDLDGDGHDDFAIGDPFLFEVNVYSGATSAPIQTVVSPNAFFGDEFGWAIAGAGDIDLDGIPDLIVGDPESTISGPGQTWVFSGKDWSILAHWAGGAVTDELGVSVSGGRDLNMDGIPDVLIGGRGATAAWIFSGADKLPITQIASATPTMSFWRMAAIAGDIDGDGFPDAILGDPTASVGGEANVGIVRVTRLLPAGIALYGAPTAGCAGPQILGAGNTPRVDNPNFTITMNHAPASALSLLLVTDVPDIAGSDLFQLGVQLFVGIAGASEFYGLDMPSGAGGFGVAAAPIPNNPGLAGRTFYAQALSAWGGCQPTTFGLSASSAVAITVQP